MEATVRETPGLEWAEPTSPQPQDQATALRRLGAAVRNGQPTVATPPSAATSVSIDRTQAASLVILAQRVRETREVA